MSGCGEICMLSVTDLEADRTCERTDEETDAAFAASCDETRELERVSAGWPLKMNKVKGLGAKARRQLLIDSTQFSEYDWDSDQKLEFEQFLAMQPELVRQRHSSDDINKWFEFADVNGDGSLCVSEYFRWSLSKSLIKYGKHTLEEAFARYDRNSTGDLELHEFENACQEMGFGNVAVDIFKSLDNDNFGVFTYRRLFQSLEDQVSVGPTMKQMLSALVWSEDAGRQSQTESNQHALDTRDWAIRGLDAASVRQELQKHLASSGAHVYDLMHLFDQDGDDKLLIDDMEFYAALRDKFGCVILC